MREYLQALEESNPVGPDAAESAESSTPPKIISLSYPASGWTAAPGSEDLNDLLFRPYRYGRSVSEYACLFIASTTYEVGGVHSISLGSEADRDAAIEDGSHGRQNRRRVV